MKKKLALLVTPLVMLATGTAVANTNMMGCCLSPYLGVDAQIRHMPFQKDFGGNVLKKNYPQGNFFAGLRLDYFGLEAGYTVSKKKHGTRNNVNGAPVFGVAPAPLGPLELSTTQIHRATSRIHGWNFNLMGYLPIFCPENHVELVGGVGISQFKHRAHRTLSATSVFEGDVPGTTDIELDVVNTHFNKRKAVLRLTGGIQHMLTDCFGIRALVNWENTAKLRIQGRDDETGERGFLARTKNSFNYGLGVFTNF